MQKWELNFHTVLSLFSLSSVMALVTKHLVFSIFACLALLCQEQPCFIHSGCAFWYLHNCQEHVLHSLSWLAKWAGSSLPCKFGGKCFFLETVTAFNIHDFYATLHEFCQDGSLSPPSHASRFGSSVQAPIGTILGSWPPHSFYHHMRFCHFAKLSSTVQHLNTGHHRHVVTEWVCSRFLLPR